MLELKNLTFEAGSPQDRRIIVDGIDLEIDDGSFTVITGPNGSGKSTLAKLIMGIEQPTSGCIIWNGEDITGLSVTERAKRGIGFAFQQPVRFKGLTIRDLICIAAGRDMTAEEACACLSEVGLCAIDYVGRELNSSLSGGELKRVEIAMLIARGVKLSLFDEPEAGIDLWSFQNLIRVFEHLRETSAGSLLIISHQERILSIADRIIVLDEGRIRRTGTRDEILPELLEESSACVYYNTNLQTKR